MGLFDGLFGSKKTDDRLGQLEERVNAIEELIEEEHQDTKELQDKILDILSEPGTTAEIAEKLGKSRSWTSYILNQLEKKGNVREKGMCGREILYEKVERLR